jgi:acetyltransferase-like isoleucine patch superfamily enzyme
MIKIHPTADVQSKNIGDNTSIWQYVVVLPNAQIGKNCNICSHCFIENDVKIGDNVTLKFFVEVCDGVTLENDVFVAPNVSFTNDFNPRSKKTLMKPARTLVKEGASIAAGVALKPGITIGKYAFIGLGSVVTKDIPDFTVWLGNPAKQRGYVTKDAVLLDSKLWCKETKKQYKLNEQGEPIELY